MAQSRKPLGAGWQTTRPAAPHAVCAHPERLVGLGFRRGLTALTTRDMTNLEFAWQDFANAVGPDRATALVAELSLWCRAVRKCAGRRIETFPLACPGFCRDECLAIAMIAACQHGASQQNASRQTVCPALRACAFALVGSNELDEPLQAAARFGNGLASAGQVLSVASVCDGLAGLPAAGLRPS